MTAEHSSTRSLRWLAGLSALPVLPAASPAREQRPLARGSAARRCRYTKLHRPRQRHQRRAGQRGRARTGDGVLLVDSGSAEHAPRGAEERSAARSVRTLFNTHYHADQTGGNALFAAAGAEIHAHTDHEAVAGGRLLRAGRRPLGEGACRRKRCRRSLSATRARSRPAPRRVEFGYLLEAHTRGDAYVYFRDSNVLAVGDVVSPLRDPVLDWFAGGWLGGRVDAHGRPARARQ